MKRSTFIALGVVLLIAIVVRIQLGRSAAPAEQPIVKDTPPKPAPKPSPSPSISASAPKTTDEWVEDTEAFAWPKPPPPKKDEVHAVDATHIMVDRGFLEHALKDQALVARSARMIPEQVAGKVVGVKLFGVRPHTFFDRLGLRNGDRVEAMNGMPLSDPEQALRAYVHLRTATRVFVTLTRAGAPLTLHYLITTS